MEQGGQHQTRNPHLKKLPRIAVGEPRLDYPRLLARVREVVDDVLATELEGKQFPVDAMPGAICSGR